MFTIQVYDVELTRLQKLKLKLEQKLDNLIKRLKK